jgi:hypothetical protein
MSTIFLASNQMWKLLLESDTIACIPIHLLHGDEFEGRINNLERGD